MAKLISLYRDDVQCPLGRRELPLPFDENIAMVMKLPDLILNRLPSGIKNAELDSFVDKCKLLTPIELNDCMQVTSQEVFELIGPNVPCVGCRRSVERLFHELLESGQEALYPVSLIENGKLGLVPKVIASSTMLFILLKYYGSRLSTMVESITTKSRQTRRCPLHSLDAHRARPSGVQWRPLWDSMAQECREELTLVEADTLLDTLEAYLQKHRFCPECRLKVLRAYSLLVGEVEPGEEKGYKPLLYLGLKCCPAEKHIHVQCNTDLISLLIARAEPELVGGSRRERHAKTMEVAQEEVVTCVGICLLERLQRLAQRLREEEQMVDMLQFATLQALRRSFEIAVESKRGVSQLELLCEELSREEAIQKERKEAKKQRRKKKRNKNKEVPLSGSDSNCLVDDGDECNEDDEDEEVVAVVPLPPVQVCHPPPPDACHCSSGCGQNQSNATKNKGGKGIRKGVKAQRTTAGATLINNNELERKTVVNGHDGEGSGWSSSRSPSPTSLLPAEKHSSGSIRVLTTTRGPSHPPSVTAPRKCPQESGYCSTNSSNLTTPEGSDVACTEGLCNHHSGSPVQCRPSPSPVPEGHDLMEDEVHCNCVTGEEDEDKSGGTRMPKGYSTCPVHFKLRENCRNGRSLQQMLDEWHVNSEGEDEEESFIPIEEVQAFRNQASHVHEQRRQLRNDLRLKFDQLCGRVNNSSGSSESH